MAPEETKKQYFATLAQRGYAATKKSGKLTAETLSRRVQKKNSQQKREINLLLRELCASAVPFSEKLHKLRKIAGIRKLAEFGEECLQERR